MDALKEAQELYAESMDALRDQRKQIQEDIEFSDPSSPQQWEEDQLRLRENDPGGKRPCLVLDQTQQYVANVSGQVEKQPPGLHAIPVGGGADKRAAEQIDGRFRHVEYASRAVQHYTRAMTSAARTGVGYLIIRPDYVDRALNYQEPRIGSEGDPLKVVFDPWSVDLDGKDATFGFVLSSINPRVFMRRWGKKAEQKDFGDEGAQEKGDERKSVLVAEQWYQETTSVNVVVYNDENKDPQSEAIEDALWYEQVQASGMQYEYVRSYKDKRQSVKWRMMSGAEILEESDYPADSIGIVPCYGYVSFVDGRMKYCGIPRRARSPQQAYNYHMSELMVPNTMILMPERAIGSAGVKDLWDRARTDRRGFMPYSDLDENGPVSQPQLMPIDGVNHELGAQRALQDIQASIGMYQANLGAPSNESSGVAIESRKEQGEASTAHFPSHLAASLTQVGKIVMEMDARLSDVRRKQPIIGVDMSAGQIVVDPDQKESFKRTDEGASINPKVGQYGVRVVIGASYATQRTQTNQAFTSIIQGAKDPNLMAAILPFWAQTLDFPGSDKFAQAMGAMAPAPVKAILQPEGGEQEKDPATLMQELEQCKQALNEAVQVAQEAQQEVATLTQANEDKAEENRIREYDSKTKRMQVEGANLEQVAAVAEKVVNDMLAPVVGQMDQVLNPPQQEQEMPEEPDPMLQEMAQGQQQIADSMAAIAEQVQRGQQDIAQGQESIAQMLQELAALTRKTRKRIPVRDHEGNITEVIDRMED